MSQAVPTPRVSDKLLVRIQAISGLTFAVFLVLHLSTAMSSLLGQAQFDATQRAVRNYYRFFLIEIVAVIGAAFVHIAAAVLRIQRRRRRRKAAGSKPEKLTLRMRMHRYTGWYMMLAFAGHVVATRSPSLIYGRETDMTFLTFSLAALPWFFYPYYVGLGFSGLYHLGHGSLAALRIVGVGLGKGATAPRSRPFWTFAAASAVIALSSILAIGGQLYPLDMTRFADWRALAAELMPASWLP